MNNIYFVVLSIYLPAAVVGSTIPSLNLTGNICHVCAIIFHYTIINSQRICSGRTRNLFIREICSFKTIDLF